MSSARKTDLVYPFSKHHTTTPITTTTDILGSIPMRVRGRDHMIYEKHVTHSPRRRKDSVFVGAESAKLPIQMLSRLLSELRSQEHLGDARRPHAVDYHFGVGLHQDTLTRPARAYFR